MKFKLISIIVSVSLLGCTPLSKIYEPDSLVVQSGSYVGATAVGVSYNIDTYYHPEFIVGYTPSLIAKYDILSLSMKNTFYTLVQEVKPYIGHQFMHLPFDSDVFILTPSRYPKDYYPSTAIRSAPYIGVEYNSFYLEFSSLDLYLETYVRSDYNMKLHEIGTYGIGYRFKY
jgi:hypothetical protein